MKLKINYIIMWDFKQNFCTAWFWSNRKKCRYSGIRLNKTLGNNYCFRKFFVYALNEKCRRWNVVFSGLFIAEISGICWNNFICYNTLVLYHWLENAENIPLNGFQYRLQVKWWIFRKYRGMSVWCLILTERLLIPCLITMRHGCRLYPRSE